MSCRTSVPFAILMLKKGACSLVGDGAAATKGPPRRGFSNTWSRLTHARQPQETVLHIDVTSSAITTVDREKEATVAKVD